MKKILLSGIFILIMLMYADAQSLLVNDSAQISLITCSPGPEVYEKFGHTAIRYVDPSTHQDIVFNYGIFDFNQPGFYYKFVKGETYYMLGVYDTQLFLPQYALRNSQVTEQVLNLTREEKQRLMDALFLNYMPENRNYLYNFVFDNCSTRPRDRILQLFQGKQIKYNLPDDNRTFREWVAEYAGSKTWLMVGIDLVFGKDADKTASKWETMFLPEVLSREFSAVQVMQNDSVSRPLIKSEKILIEKKDVMVKFNRMQQPLTVTLLILVLGIIITVYEFRKKRNFKIFDSLLMLFTGLAGIIIFYLMFFSIHPLVKMNVNLLWCNPLNIILGVMIWNKKLKTPINVWQIVNIILFLTILLVGAMSIQILNAAFIPLIVLLLIRSLAWLQKKWK
ncbi:MAG: lipoprotein N-acyltransferase Lnb domain-containing protein [Paludibacteraceae bacterium]